LERGKMTGNFLENQGEKRIKKQWDKGEDYRGRRKKQEEKKGHHHLLSSSPPLERDGKPNMDKN
jgi:hypothetical protein